MTQRMLRLGLAVICAGLGAVLVSEISVKAFTPSVSSVSEAGTPALSEMPSLPDIDSMVVAILERPLFSASRLPYEETVEIDEVETGEELTEVYGRLKAADRPVLEEGATTCCYAKSEKSWIADPDGIVWEAFFTNGESTTYGAGPALGTLSDSLGNDKCCLPKSVQAA